MKKLYTFLFFVCFFSLKSCKDKDKNPGISMDESALMKKNFNITIVDKDIPLAYYIRSVEKKLDLIALGEKNPDGQLKSLRRLILYSPGTKDYIDATIKDGLPIRLESSTGFTANFKNYNLSAKTVEIQIVNTADQKIRIDYTAKKLSNEFLESYNASKLPGSLRTSNVNFDPCNEQGRQNLEAILFGANLVQCGLFIVGEITSAGLITFSPVTIAGVIACYGAASQAFEWIAGHGVVEGLFGKQAECKENQTESAFSLAADCTTAITMSVTAITNCTLSLLGAADANLGCHCPDKKKEKKGDSKADPHITTTDGYYYDFQGFGEFIAIKSTTDNFEVQSRQEPYNGTDVASINTAVGVQTGNDIVSIHHKPFEIYINNVKQTIVTTKKTLNNGAYIEPLSGYLNSFDIVTSNNDKVRVIYYNSYLDYEFFPNENRAGKIEGLLGNLDGDKNNDLKIRNGAQVDSKFESLYPKYADSWRVGTTSLLHYNAGQSTDTFTRKDLPKKREAVANDIWNSAITTCQKAGVTNEPYLSNCAFDISLTGDNNFINSALYSQKERNNVGPEVISGDLNVYSNVTLTSTMGQSTLTDSCLINYATGEVFQLKDGAKYGSKVDGVFSSYCGIDLFTPAAIIKCDASCGIGLMNKLIVAQKWPAYRTGQVRLGEGDAGRFDVIYSYKWANISSSEDILKLGDYRLNPKDDLYSVTVGNFKDCGVPTNPVNFETARLFIFVTQEGKYGVFRIKSVSVTGKTSKMIIDIKVQK